MTGKLDKRMRATAKRLINDFGKAITIRRTARSYDPSSGTETTTTTDHSTNTAPPESYRLDQIDGTNVHRGDQRLFVAASGLSIDPDPQQDTVIMDSTTWQVVAVEGLWSGEQVAGWYLQVRR